MISIFCGLNKVIINSDLAIKSGLNIIKNPYEIEEVYSDETRSVIGALYHDSLMNKPVLLRRILLEDGNLHPNGIMLNFRGYSQYFLFAIWLLKDNSINLEDIILTINKTPLFTNNNPILFSNSQGEYKSVYLTNDEVKEALIWFELLKPIFIHDTPSENEEPVSKMVHIYNSKKNIDYYNYNRLQRAVRFVGLARSESFLPAKITFYISALECLFSNSKTEVRMQVADRTTRVLSDVFEERTRINKIISIAYEFRSSYIHGSVNNQKAIRKALKPYETIEELSFGLDEILRKVLRRFLTDLNHVVHMDGASFSVWISELLYK